MSIRDRSAPGIRISAVPNERGSVSQRVNLDGRVLSFTYEDCERKSDKVTLQLDNHDLSLFDNEALFGGVVLEVSWGYPENMSPPRRVVLKTIKGFNPLTVEGYAASVLLNRKVKTRCWENKRRSDVVNEIAEENGYEGLFAFIQKSAFLLDVINQTAETDAQFLRRLAKEEGFEFWIDDTGLHWHERRLDLAPTHLFIWRISQKGEIISVNVESNLMRRAARVTVKGRDPLTKSTFEESANNDTVDRSTLGDSREVVETVDPETGETDTGIYIDVEDEEFQQSMQDVRVGYVDLEKGQTVLDERNAVYLSYAESAENQQQAKHLAEKRFKQAERATVKLSVQVVGDPTIRAKSIVEIAGISEVLSGKYYVNEVKHTISSSGYICHLKLTRDAKGTFAKRLTARQKGNRNKHELLPEKSVREVEVIDPDTGKAHIEYRPGPG